MLAIQGLKCIYDTGARGWSLEIAMAAENEIATRRFDVDGPEDAEMLIEAFEDAAFAHFDPATGEIVFAYEFAELDEDDEDEADEDEAESDEDDEESDDEESEDGDEDERKA